MKRQNTKTPVYDAEYIEHSSGPWRHKPRPRYVDARPLGWLGIVAIAALFVAALVIVGRVW
jgi:predicted phage tail protein